MLREVTLPGSAGGEYQPRSLLTLDGFPLFGQPTDRDTVVFKELRDLP